MGVNDASSPSLYFLFWLRPLVFFVCGGLGDGCDGCDVMWWVDVIGRGGKSLEFSFRALFCGFRTCEVFLGTWDYICSIGFIGFQIPNSELNIGFAIQTRRILLKAYVTITYKSYAIYALVCLFFSPSIRETQTDATTWMLQCCSLLGFGFLSLRVLAVYTFRDEIKKHCPPWCEQLFFPFWLVVPPLSCQLVRYVTLLLSFVLVSFVFAFFCLSGVAIDRSIVRYRNLYIICIQHNEMSHI